MKQTLMLLRHAKAEPWSPGVDDHARPLAIQGIQHMSRLASWLVNNRLQPEAVLCSTATRTRETLQPLLECWHEAAPSVRFEETMYSASTGTLVNFAETAFGQNDRVLMVGHNPGFESLALGLLDDADRNIHYKMPTGTLAVFEFPDGFANSFPAATLAHWIRRRDLKGD